MDFSRDITNIPGTTYDIFKVETSRDLLLIPGKFSVAKSENLEPSILGPN
jgi:hypothetical protein